MIASTLIYLALVAKKTREDTFLVDARIKTEKFGPLKVVLGKIPALFADRTVRLQSPTQSSPLTQISGNRRSGEQGRQPPPSHNRIGEMLRFASK